jgi:hypothetical protein
MLRGRYMIAKFHISRPYLYKALRIPSHLSEDDFEQIRSGLRNAMNWPIILGVFRDMKSCIPIKFAFCSQYVPSPQFSLLSIILGRSNHRNNIANEYGSCVDFSAKFSSSTALRTRPIPACALHCRRHGSSGTRRCCGF